jgi:hypothetical protein
MNKKMAFEFANAVQKRQKAFFAWDRKEVAWRANFENAAARKAAERAWERYQAACVEVMDAENA